MSSTALPALPWLAQHTAVRRRRKKKKSISVSGVTTE
jgi:hypothetical protein